MLKEISIKFMCSPLLNSLSFILAVAAPTTTVAATTVANTTIASNVSSTVASNLTTIAAATTTQAVDTRPKIQVQFSFPVNCSTAYNASTKSQFEASVRTSIANRLSISESLIEGMQASCGSVVIKFIIVGQSSNTSLASVNTTVQALKVYNAIHLF